MKTPKQMTPEELKRRRKELDVAAKKFKSILSKFIFDTLGLRSNKN